MYPVRDLPAEHEGSPAKAIELLRSASRRSIFAGPVTIGHGRACHRAHPGEFELLEALIRARSRILLGVARIEAPCFAGRPPIY
jgi:hypothetical protein